MRWLYAVTAATILVCALAAARQTFYRPITFDEAYNLQIAKSISTSFCYCTRYRPERVFPVEESTNGLVQYVGAGFFALTRSPDDAKAGTVAVGVLILGAALLLLDPWLVFLAVFLYFVWPWFHVTVTAFGGEVFAIAFSLLGLWFLRRNAMLGAIACFGVALESKLISIIVILPAAWAMLFAAKDDGVDFKRRVFGATRRSLVIAAGSAIALGLLIAFSIVHSTRTFDVATIWRAFSGYILNMIAQGQRAPSAPAPWQAVQMILRFDSPIVLALFVPSAALLLWANPGYVAFLSATCTWWLYYGKTERHLVISFFATLVLAWVEGRALLGRIALRRRTSALTLSSASIATVGSIAVCVGLATHSSFNVTPSNSFSDREHVLSTSDGHMVYGTRLIDVLRDHPFVLTSGWFQMPEISLRENLEFYDRTNPANANLPRQGAVLFFDKGNHLDPITTVAGNCSRVLYSRGPLVVCTPNQNEPFAFQPPVSPSRRQRE